MFSCCFFMYYLIALSHIFCHSSCSHTLLSHTAQPIFMPCHHCLSLLVYIYMSLMATGSQFFIVFSAYLLFHYCFFSFLHTWFSFCPYTRHTYYIIISHTWLVVVFLPPFVFQFSFNFACSRRRLHVWLLLVWPSFPFPLFFLPPVHRDYMSSLDSAFSFSSLVCMPVFLPLNISFSSFRSFSAFTPCPYYFSFLFQLTLLTSCLISRFSFSFHA